MALTETEVLAISLGAVLGGFALIAIGIVACFLRKHHQSRTLMHDHLLNEMHHSNNTRTMQLNPVYDDDFADVDVIPDVVNLLKSCKSLASRLVSTVLQELSVASNASAQAMLDAAHLIGPRAAALTDAMHSPEETAIIRHATLLVSAIDQLVRAAKRCCPSSTMPWLDTFAVGVIADFRRLALSVDRMQAQRAAVSA
eukprot:TRINITY_DN11451_c0_g2_i1.p1 TRINITY_DN11451_c0_g2~~TRINITY_DN11451_c0_g2_i1.p1  ORF type:complete len:198 (+),score=39.56 TRINITY_DN11451_c0_g2_i1:213-806(+)